MLLYAYLHTVHRHSSMVQYIVSVSPCIGSQPCLALLPVWLPQDQWLCLPHSIWAAWCLEETTAVPLTQSQDDWRALGACKQFNSIPISLSIFCLPAVYHELIDNSWTPRRWGKTHSFCRNYPYTFNICMVFKWLVSETPYLIHDATITPHITGSGVFSIVKCLFESKILL